MRRMGRNQHLEIILSVLLVLLVFQIPKLRASSACLAINETLRNETTFMFGSYKISLLDEGLSVSCSKQRNGKIKHVEYFEKQLDCSQAKHFKIEKCNLLNVSHLMQDMNAINLESLYIDGVNIGEDDLSAFQWLKVKALTLTSARGYFVKLFQQVLQLEKLILNKMNTTGQKDILKPLKFLTHLEITNPALDLEEDFFLHNTNLETLKMSETSILLETEKTFDNARLEIGRLPEGLLKSNVNLQTLWWKDYTLLGTKSRLFPARFFESLSKLHRFEYETDSMLTEVSFEGDLPRSLKYFRLDTMIVSPIQIGNAVKKLPQLETIILHRTGFNLTSEHFLHLKGPALKSFYYVGDSDISCDSCEMLLFDGLAIDTCTYGNKSHMLSVEKESLIGQFCTSLTIYLIVSLGSLIFLLAFIITVFSVKVRIRIILYHHRYLGNFFKSEPEDNKSFDAYISYADQDWDFVLKIVQNLEGGTDEKLFKNRRDFKFCIKIRDWKVGLENSRNLSDSLANSRRTILIISNHFINSSCVQEFDIANGGSKILAIMRVKSEGGDCQVTEEDLNNARLQPLKLFLETFKYLREDDPDIWRKLIYKLPHKKIKPRRKDEEENTQQEQSVEIKLLMAQENQTKL